MIRSIDAMLLAVWNLFVEDILLAAILAGIVVIALLLTRGLGVNQEVLQILIGVGGWFAFVGRVLHVNDGTFSEDSIDLP